MIKLDPVEIPEIASAAETIATKIFYALGYHAPENYIVYAHTKRFVIAPGTEVEDTYGDKMPLTDFRFRRSIRLVPRLPDGSMRVTASKYLPGIPIGPFRYYETRSDDPNDVIAHEDRRELRGLRLFAAWAEPRRHPRAEHAGRLGRREWGAPCAALHAGLWLDPRKRIRRHARRPSHLYVYARLRDAKRNMVGFGLRVPEYRRAKWPPYPEYEAVGRIESELFDCVAWRNDYPNPAFMRMTARDAFWAASPRYIKSSRPGRRITVLESPSTDSKFPDGSRTISS